MYTVFLENTTVTASEMNANFYHCVQGNWIPMGGVSLGYTSNVYDLGSNSYKFNSVHCQNINLSGDVGAITSVFNQVSSFSVNSVNTQTARIVFSGLNGDTSYVYYIVARIISNTNTAGGDIGIAFNGDSAASYNVQMQYHSTTDVATYTTESIATLAREWALATTGSQSILIQSHIYTRLSTQRIFLSRFSGHSQNKYVDYAGTLCGKWSNVADTITSFVFFRNNGKDFATGTSIQIFTKG